MHDRDWALVVFTVLSQAAVGGLLTVQLLPLLSRSRVGGRFDDTSAHARVVVLAVLLASLFIALFHLATPLQAARAVVNVGSSWLSREIVFGGLFATLLTTLVALESRATPAHGDAHSRSPRWRRGLGWATAGAAVTFLYCQTQIYRLPAQPAWDAVTTPAAFAATTLRLGVLGIAVHLAVTSRSPAVLRGLCLAGLVALATELVITPFHLASLGGAGSEATRASLERLTGEYGWVLLAKLVLLAGAAVSLVMALRGDRRADGPRRLIWLTGVALGLTVLAELTGRFLFYATQVRVGI